MPGMSPMVMAPAMIYTPPPAPGSPRWTRNLYTVLVVLKLVLLGLRLYIFYVDIRAYRAERRAAASDEEKAAQDGEIVGLLGYESYEDGDEKDSGYGDD